MEKKFIFLKHILLSGMFLFGSVQDGFGSQPAGFEAKTGMNFLGDTPDFALLRATIEGGGMPGSATQYKAVVLYRVDVAQPERLTVGDVIVSANAHVRSKSFCNVEHALPSLIDVLPKGLGTKLKSQYGVKLANKKGKGNIGFLKGCWNIGKKYRYLVVVGMVVLDHRHANDTPAQIQELLSRAQLHKKRKCPGCHVCNGLGFGIWAVGSDSGQLYHRMFHRARV